MKTFKIDTLDDINYYLSLQKKAGLYVRLILQFRNGKIKIEVRNNSDLTVFEYKRIHDKLSRAQQYSSVDQALDQVLDDSEGAGLGLIIMIVWLVAIVVGDIIKGDFDPFLPWLYNFAGHVIILGALWSLND